MYKFYFLLFISSILLACSPSNNQIPLEVKLASEEIENFKYEVIRYAGKLAPRSTEETKFSPAFDEYYQELAQKHDLKAYHVHDSKVYFLLTRLAPSIHLKKVAIGGVLEKDESGKITHYEEVFRTFKMEEEELLNKSHVLFNLMVNNGDLSPYYFENSNGVEYIEFPNDNVFYNKENRKWESIQKSPVEDLRNLNLH